MSSSQGKTHVYKSWWLLDWCHSRVKLIQDLSCIINLETSMTTWSMLQPVAKYCCILCMCTTPQVMIPSKQSSSDFCMQRNLRVSVSVSDIAKLTQVFSVTSYYTGLTKRQSTVCDSHCQYWIKCSGSIFLPYALNKRFWLTANIWTEKVWKHWDTWGN